MRTATEVQRIAGQPHHHPPAPIIGGIDEHVHPNELTYLSEQRIGRLATVSPDGQVQNNPTNFFVDAGTGTIVIGGHALGSSKKLGTSAGQHGRVARSQLPGW